MRRGEVRRCPSCNDALEVVDGSQRTFRGRVFVTLRCPTCLHVESDWYEKPREIGDEMRRMH